MNYLDKINKIKDKKSSKVPDLVAEMLDAATKFHVLHLTVKGQGSYAQHKALNDLYDALPGLADQIAESYQGATGEIQSYKMVTAPEMQTISEALTYISDLRNKISDVQKTLPYSEIVNDFDAIKSVLNSAFYKLKFLE